MRLMARIDGQYPRAIQDRDQAHVEALRAACRAGVRRADVDALQAGDLADHGARQRRQVRDVGRAGSRAQLEEDLGFGLLVLCCAVQWSGDVCWWEERGREGVQGRGARQGVFEDWMLWCSVRVTVLGLRDECAGGGRVLGWGRSGAPMW